MGLCCTSSTRKTTRACPKWYGIPTEGDCTSGESRTDHHPLDALLSRYSRRQPARHSTLAGSPSCRDHVSEDGSKSSLELPANARRATSIPKSEDPGPEPGSARSRSHRLGFHGNL